MPIDLSSIVELNSIEVELLHPRTKVPTGTFVTLAGPEHSKRKAFRFAQQRKLRARIAKLGKLSLTDPEEDEADEIEMLVACTLGWRDLIVNGKALPFSAEAARELYGTPWIREQLKAAVDERELFFKPSEEG